MLKETRHEKILLILREQGSIQVSELCSTLQVTPMTIRRDLNELEKEGKLLRTHGGALLTDSEGSLAASFSLRSKAHVEQKKRIAQTAVQEIKMGQKLFLGSGTTIYALSRQISAISNLTVVTDSIPIATEVGPLPNIHSVMIGGEMNSATLSTTGNMAENMLVHFKFDAAYVGLTAIDADGQMYLNSITEFGIMQVIFTLVDKVYLLVDSSKIGREDFVCIGKIVPGYTIITDSISDEYRKNYEDMDVRILVAE